MVADVRAPTPSAAAEMIAPDISALETMVGELDARGRHLTQATLERRKRETHDLQHRLMLMSPKTQLATMRGSLTAETARLHLVATRRIERGAYDVERHMASLRALNPAALLQRGYAHIASEPSGVPVRLAAMLTPGDRLRATFADGSIRATVDDVSTPPTAVVQR
jgi:exodeoxyribonuclease VII large subunit